MRNINLPSEVLGFACSQTVFWSGAGISADGPTFAPLGAELTTRAFEYAFQPESAELLARYYRALELPRTSPRLETVLDVVFRVDGPAQLVDLLSDVRDARPNSIHRLLAAAAGAGARQITTNFDTCLEQAGADEVVHIHDSFVGDPSGTNLGATLAQVERGLTATSREALDTYLLGGVNRSLLVFAGYSGSDFFDVDPYLRSFEREALSSTTVLWLEHSHDPGAEITNGEAAEAQRRQLEWLAAAGAQVFLCTAPTLAVLAALAQNWRLDPPLQGSGSKPHWRSGRLLTGAARRRASLELYLLMGLHREVDRLLEATPPVDAGEWNALAHTRWSQGRKRESLEAWRHALGGPALVEREAAIAWITGRYRRARKIALTTLRDADAKAGGSAELPFEIQLVMAETLARVWEHMRRFPDSRLFATEKLRRYTLAHLPDPADLARQGRPLGTHLVSRVRSARAALGAGSEGQWNAIESFGEYEALSASLNYQHGQLRAQAKRGRVSPERYRRLYRDRITIGATSAAMRVMLLPGAEAVFSLREVITAVRGVDMTRWHRWRFIAVALARRLPRRSSIAALGTTKEVS